MNIRGFALLCILAIVAPAFSQITLTWEVGPEKKATGVETTVRAGIGQLTSVLLVKDGGVPADNIDTITITSVFTFDTPQDVDSDGSLDSTMTKVRSVDFSNAFGDESFDGHEFYLNTSFIGKSGKLKVTAEYAVLSGGVVTQRITKDTEIFVNPGPPTLVTMSASQSSVEAATSIEVVVTASDKEGNTATSLSGSNGTLSATGDASFIGGNSLVYDKGVAKRSIRNSKAESVNVTLGGTSVTVAGSPLLLTWTPGITNSFLFTLLSSLPKAGDTPYTEADQSVQVRLAALDVSKNIDTSEDRRIGLVMPSGSSVLTPHVILLGVPAVEFVQGVAVFNVTSNIGQDVDISLKFVAAFRGNPLLSASVKIRFTTICDGVNNYQDEAGVVACKTVRDLCPAGSKQIQAPNRTVNRECQDCNGQTEFQDQPNQVFCHPMGPECPVAFVELTNPSKTTNRTCRLCNSSIEYQDEANQTECKPIKSCVIGEDLVQESTASTDRVCRSCPAGTADLDSDPDTTCEMCSPQGLVAIADFVGDYLMGEIKFSETLPNISIDVSLVPNMSSIISWRVLTNDCEFPIVTTFENGDLTSRHGIPSSTDSMEDGILSLVGIQSIYSRGLEITLNTSDGNEVVYCSNIDEWEVIPTFTDETGKTTCSNITVCEAGTSQTNFFSRSEDRKCGACDGVSTFQPSADKRSCYPTEQCIADVGFKEKIAPTPTSNRECEPITCPKLPAPKYGVTFPPCNGTNGTVDFNQFCQTNCLPTFTITGGDLFRTCSKTGGYEGAELQCGCGGGLLLDPVAEQCSPTCGAGTYQSDGECKICSPACSAGFFESQACGGLLDRECSECSSCEAGTFSSGGCDPFSNQDTICSEFLPCPDGEYETKPGTVSSNRECSKCFGCTSTTFASSGCCGTKDTVCKALTINCRPDEYEESPPALAPQGGFSSDRTCRPFKTCGGGQYYAQLGNATSNHICEDCTTCPDGMYAKTACVAGSDSSLGSDTECEAWKECPVGQFISWPGTAHKDVECSACRECLENEYVVSPCNGTKDTECALRTVCDPLLEFRSFSGNDTADTECTLCTKCEDIGLVLNESCSAFEDTHCVNASEVPPSVLNCERGTVLIGTFPNHFCVPCNPCEAGQWAPNGPVCRGPTTFNDPECKDWTVCPEGSFEYMEPTASTDRICKTCSSCGLDEFISGGCAGKNDTECTKNTPCSESDSYEVAASHGDTPHQCAECRKCQFTAASASSQFLTSGEFERVGCDGQQNRICETFTECAQNEAVLRRGSPTSDRVCYECGRLSFSRQDVNPYACPPQAEDICAADDDETTTPPPVDNFYLRVSLAFNAEFSEVIVDVDHRISEFVFAFNDAFREYLESIQGGLNLDGTEASSGSIVVSFSIRGSDDDINGLLDALQNSANFSDFSMSYEQYELDVIPDSVVVDVMSTSTLTTKTTTTETEVTVTTQTSQTTITATSITSTEFFGVITNASNTTTTATTSEPDVEAEAADKDDGLSGGAIAGIVVAVLVVLVLIIVAMVLVAKRKNAEHVAPDELKMSDVEGGDEPGYLGVGVDAEDSGLFGNQVADENRKLRQEVEQMRKKVAMKDAASRHQATSQTAAERQLDKAIAAGIKKKNEQLKVEIAALKGEMKRSKPTAFQKAASSQAKLMAEKAQLEEEIRQATEIEQLAIEQIAIFEAEREGQDDSNNDYNEF
eukprot:m.54401 g.54401  ORF g.54401 m.54401 type:complete len:1704 (+) comp10924_c0_seq1:282-5393(+)